MDPGPLRTATLVSATLLVLVAVVATALDARSWRSPNERVMTPRVSESVYDRYCKIHPDGFRSRMRMYRSQLLSLKGSVPFPLQNLPSKWIVCASRPLLVVGWWP